MVNYKKIYHMLARRKYLAEDKLLEDTGLKRALTLLDLTALGVGSTLGVGVYVLAGSVSKTVAGPAVVISFLIAGIASCFAGICYAEFAARVPKAGSAYVYSYVCVGELIAFIIGWNLILEYVVGTASVVRGLSGYIDDMCDNCISTKLNETIHMDSDFVADYPDFFSTGLAIFFSFIVAFGVKESTHFNNVFTILNLGVVTYAIICGSFKADIANWKIPESEVPPGYGTGGFAPYGLSGIVSGAATCFYGFVGFDCVATTGEEAKNPQRNIPIAIVISLTIIFLAYFGISTVLTMMLPYYLQDENAPLPHVFEYYGWTVAYWIVTVGAIFGLCASLLGALFPLPRVMYAMSNDGIIYKFLGIVHPKFQTPFVGTLLAGLLIAFLATIFDLQQLVDMMSIGTLLAYSIVAACVLILRYQPGDEREYHEASKLERQNICKWKQLLNLNRTKWPGTVSGDIATWGCLTLVICCFAVGSMLTFATDQITNVEPWAVTLTSIFGACFIFNIIVIGVQPTSKKELNFRVPLVPVLPAVSLLMNIILMLALSAATWIRFVIWMVIGFAIYFGYGIRHSKEVYRDPKAAWRNRSSLGSYVAEGIENLGFTKH